MAPTTARPNIYYDPAVVDRSLSAGQHRQLIGGLWEQMGRKQFEYLLTEGLQPGDRLLDIGCGCFRAGVHFVAYLTPGHYYGIDISQALIEAGYDREIVRAGLAQRLPRSNLIAGEDFDVSALGVTYEFALAQSVFTHLPLSAFTQCLTALAPWMRPGGVLLATFFEAPHPSRDFPTWVQQPAGFATHGDRDPFHFSAEEILEVTRTVPGWAGTWVGDWSHPRSQKMLKVVRTVPLS